MLQSTKFRSLSFGSFLGIALGVYIITSPFEEGLLFQVADNYEKVSPSQGLRPAVAVGI